MELISLKFDKYMDLPYHICMYIHRVYQQLEPYLEPGQVLVLYGPRRAGKTTLIQEYLKTTKWRYKLDSGDNIRTQHLLGSQDFSQILPYAEGLDLLVIDEAQHIPNIGMALKILVDQLPGIRIIATGSSSFDLSGQIGEPLTGRKRTLTLYPLSQEELLSASHTRFDLKEKLHDFLLYGSYPQILIASSAEKKRTILSELVDSYLLKDILSLEKVKGSQTLLSILKLLALQIGSQVSLNEISKAVQIDVKTVARYLDLLEKAFVIHHVSGYSGNLRSEVTSKSKYYFLDTGIRNAIIQQFNTLDLRSDVGQLWENFFVMERLKFRTYHEVRANMYFWRTYSQQKIDLVEERNGLLHGFECKWSEKKHTSIPSEWKLAYPKASFSLVHQGNYLEFLT